MRLKNIQLLKGGPEHGEDPSSFVGTSETISQAYNPFIYYYDNVPGRIADAILGGLKAEVKIHTLFATIDPENEQQLIKCAEHFGFPSYFSRDVYAYVSSETHIPDHETFHIVEHLAQVKWDLYLQKLVIYTLTGQLDTLVQNKNMFECSIAALNRTLAEQKRIDLAKECNPPNFLTTVATAVNEYLEEQLEQISPCYRNGDLHWRFTSLQCALLFMTVMDISRHVPPRFCAYKPCGNAFTPSRDSQKYCAPECRKIGSNTAYMQRTRAEAKRKKELEGIYKGPGRPKKGMR